MRTWWRSIRDVNGSKEGEGTEYLHRASEGTGAKGAAWLGGFPKGARNERLIRQHNEFFERLTPKPGSITMFVGPRLPNIQPVGLLGVVVAVELFLDLEMAETVGAPGLDV